VMINRRQFLGGLGGVAAVTGMVGGGRADIRHVVPDHRPTWISRYVQKLLSHFEQTLVESKELEVLGIPSSWSHVCQGLHPISPERTVVVNPESQRRDLDEWMKKLVHDKASRTNETASQGIGLSRRKVELILNMVEPMASAYGDHDCFERWVIQLARRESFSSSGLGWHVGLLHQFQGPPWPRTTNGCVDWWLFLIPGGGEFDSLDKEPVHVAFAYVFSHHWIKYNCFFGQELRALALCSKSLQPLGRSGIISLSRMDRYRAAQFFNRRLVEVL